MTKKRSSCEELACPSFYDACLWEGSGDRPAHLIVVGNAPSPFSVGRDCAFGGHHGKLFKHILNFIREFRSGAYADLRVYYTYAVLTALPAGKHEPPKKMLTACRPNLMRDIKNVPGVDGKLPVIVPLGPVAARAVGLQFKSIYDVTGRVLTVPITTHLGTQQYKVVPLMSMKDMHANPGKVSVEVSSLLKAAKLAIGEEDTKTQDLEILTKDYIYPKTIGEVKKLVDYVIGYYDQETKIGPDNWMISIDTETNTLFPYKKDAKVLMLSVAWDDGKSATILLDHEETPYSAEEAWVHVRRLLACPKPKVFHNGKFDLKFLEQVAGMSVNRMVWDTILGEHYLDEDKKGLYGLKKLTTIYTPGYEGYDEELHEILRASDKLDADGRDAKGNLYITDEDIIIRSEAGEPPEWMEPAAWEEMGQSIKRLAEVREKLTPDWVNPVMLQKIRTIENYRKLQKERKPKERDRSLKDINADLSLMRKSVQDDVKLFKKELGDTVRRFRADLKIKKPTKNMQTGQNRPGGFESIPLDTILSYAAIDTDVTRLIAKEQIRRTHAAGLGVDAAEVMSKLYLPATPVLADMEFRGMSVDNEYLEWVEAEILELRTRVLRELHGKFDPTINFGSPKQVAGLMQRMNYKAIQGVEAGSTNKETLEKYKKMYPETDPRYVLVDKLLIFRSADKALGGFLVKLHRLAQLDSRIHCTLHLNGTSTGRLASSGPNLLNIPKIMCRITKTQINAEGKEKEVEIHPGYNIKKVFVPSKPNFKIVNMDIKGAELRVYPVYAKDQRMIDVLLNGDDVHSVTCSQIYGIPYDDIMARKGFDPDIIDKRDRAKKTIFATFYGAGSWKIAQIINSTVEEAEKIQEGLFNAFPALRVYITKIKNQVRKKQFVKTVFGRCRRFRLAHLGGTYYSSACREAGNFLIQSTASDILLGQMCEMKEPLEQDLGGRLLITVYDSVVLELPEENVGQLKSFFDYYIVQRITEKYDWLQVPFLYDYEVGDNYGEVYTPTQEEEEAYGSV